MIRVSVLAAVLAVAMPATALSASNAECSVRSPVHTVALMELYTSEGCSDCPPADAWSRALGPLVAAGRVSPLALHVDYWDKLGWKDPFAQGLFSGRQRDLASVQGRTFVYTPQVMLGGRDFRRWSSARDFEAELKRINTQPARAQIELSLAPGRDGLLDAKAEASLATPGAFPEAVLFVAITESGLSNRVAAGENRGRTLEHDWVARGWTGPVPLAADRPATAIATARLVNGRSNAGAVAFVQDRRTGEVLQSVALRSCEADESGAKRPGADRKAR